MPKTVYSPGCAFLLYKPQLADKILTFLRNKDDTIEMYTRCCKHEPNLSPAADVDTIINTCAGCGTRFEAKYEGVSTMSLWEAIAEIDGFPFPDYQGETISIQDPCPARAKPKAHDAVRALLKKMNLQTVEARNIREHSICCGDSLYPNMPIDKVREQMRKRAESMPCEDVCVSCVSCIKAMHIGGKRPRYILDLLFGETTEPGVTDTQKWHEELNGFIDKHALKSR